ncbi:squalene/phytoene synthase family protein [Maliponia aquimaris]|uniref:Squalene/phytoene synthase n=1 Tax=Maliponia aquimaris TaxID=1673631 RepID=A0A238L4N2_9RHOB|nr:squalene/phytoene synthase family protein [Maliponia aquimaris]SMX50043.1 Squalene/phytoene synthase [Maliponia aquimaris]
MSWEPGSDLYACAQIVERGDPERFVAAMAAPVAARAVLFPLYAFNVEVARAPWVTQEPMIARMRLQWWLDALDEIAAGGFVRRHEVVTPLAQALTGVDVARLRALVEARERDLERAPFADAAALLDYLERTSGGLALTALAALGAPADRLADAVPYARGAGLVRYLRAVPDLEARGKLPLPDGRAETLAALARDQLRAMPGSLRRLRRSFGPAGAALRECAQARPLLQLVARDPGSVSEGRLALSEFRRRWALLTA